MYTATLQSTYEYSLQVPNLFIIVEGWKTQLQEEAMQRPGQRKLKLTRLQVIVTPSTIGTW